MKEIEKLMKEYEKWSLANKDAENSLYEITSNEKLKAKIGKDYDKLQEGLEYVKNIISRNKKMLVTYNKFNTGTKYYYKSSKGHRIVSKNSKNIKIDTLIFDNKSLSYKSLFFEFMKNIDSIFGTKYFHFIKIDLKKFYLNINLQHIITAIKFFVKKAYGQMTRNLQKLIKLLKKYDKIIFGLTGLSLGTYVGKLISYIVGAYIVFKEKAKVIMFFEDDMLFLFKKDKRLDLKKKFKEIVDFINRFGFELNLNKTKLGRLFYDELTFLGYSFGKRKRIYIGKETLFLRKYKFIDLVPKNIKIQDNKITNFGKIKKKVKHGLVGFYHYYKFANNIEVVMKGLKLFIRKLIRYFVWKNTDLNMFQVNQYLSNRKIVCLENI